MERPELHTESNLRTEIVESQKSQADLLKWKLVATAAIGALALSPRGQASTPPQGMLLLLCFIPLACAYVDLISVHLMLRIVVIGTYLRKSKSLLASQILDYESWLIVVRHPDNANPFAYELLALHGSSFIFSALVAVAAFIPGFSEPRYHFLFVLSGLLGIVVTATLILTFPARVRRIDQVSVLAPAPPTPGQDLGSSFEKGST